MDYLGLFHYYQNVITDYSILYIKLFIFKPLWTYSGLLCIGDFGNVKTTIFFKFQIALEKNFAN